MGSTVPGGSAWSHGRGIDLLFRLLFRLLFFLVLLDVVSVSDVCVGLAGSLELRCGFAELFGGIALFLVPFLPLLLERVPFCRLPSLPLTLDASTSAASARPPPTAVLPLVALVEGGNESEINSNACSVPGDLGASLSINCDVSLFGLDRSRRCCC